MVVHIHREIKAAMSSLPALLSLKETNKLRLSFLILGAQSCISDNTRAPSLGQPEPQTGLPVRTAGMYQGSLTWLGL